MVFTAVLLLTGLSVVAQQYSSYKGDITLTPLRFEQVGDSLYVDMDIKLQNVRVKSPLSIEFSPWVAAGGQQKSLPVVSVKGRGNYKAYERSLILDGYTAATGPNNTMITLKGYGQDYAVVNYKHVTTYEPWMENASLELIRGDMGCGESLFRITSRLVAQVKLEDARPVVIPTPPLVIQRQFTPELTFIVPQAEAVKTRELQAEVRLDFVVNKTDIDPAYMGNPRELARLRGMIDELRDDPSISVRGLEIIGYASPEGSLAGNKRLSEGRAVALRDYLSRQYDFPLSAYRTTFGGENWAGLVKALETYPLNYKDEVLSIIEYTPADETRKNRLKSLRGGAPYREMLTNIYPSLRTAICVVDYEVKGFDVQDALAVYKTRPQNLSQNEFYMVAGTMAEGSPEFIEVFETAVRMYPEDEVANLNAAIAALKNRNKLAAGRYLGNIRTLTNTLEYNNAQGALAILNENYDSARRYFQLAAQAGSQAAQKNLEQIPTE